MDQFYVLNVTMMNCLLKQHNYVQQMKVKLYFMNVLSVFLNGQCTHNVLDHFLVML